MQPEAREGRNPVTKLKMAVTAFALTVPLWLPAGVVWDGLTVLR
jgi:hypothetical protein